MGNVVDFSCVAVPSSSISLTAPHARTDVPRAMPEELDTSGAESLARGTAGGLMMARIMSMSVAERVAIVSNAARDPVWGAFVVMWALFSPAERSEIMAAAAREIVNRAKG